MVPHSQTLEIRVTYRVCSLEQCHQYSHYTHETTASEICQLMQYRELAIQQYREVDPVTIPGLLEELDCSPSYPASETHTHMHTHTHTHTHMN